MRIEAPGVYNWNNHIGLEVPQRPVSPRVEIDDETWRDGMQGTQVEHHPTTDQKDQYVSRVAQLGYVDHLDIGFPASGVMHKDVIVDLVNSSYARKDGLTFSVAARGSQIDDIVAIREIASRTGKKLEADLFLDGSDLRASIEGWDRPEMLKRLADNIALLEKEGFPVMFVPERASATSPEELFEVCKIALESGANRIAIADTTGILTPNGTSNIFRETFRRIGDKHPDIKYDFHEHNDLGMGIANCVVAAQEGVDRIHATARGIGERAGNVNLEQLLVVLNLQGLRDVDTREIQNFARMAAEILHVPIQPHESIIGERSTETASGVHANTYRKSGREGMPPIYFPYHPEDVGLEARVRIGPLSSLSNVEAVLERLRIQDVTPEKKQEILDVAKTRWGLLSDTDVKNLVGRNGHIE